MNRHDSQALRRRHRLNPLVTVADWPYQANSLYNPQASLLPDVTHFSLCRADDRPGLQKHTRFSLPVE